MSPKTTTTTTQKQHNLFWRPTTSTRTTRRYNTPGAQQSNCTLTTLIKSISTLHNSFHTPQHFPKFLLAFMTVSGIAGYVCMDVWYERSVRERTEIYSNAYHQHQYMHDDEYNDDGYHGHGDRVSLKKTVTVTENHYEGRKALFDKNQTTVKTVKLKRTPYQEALYMSMFKQQGQGATSGQEEEVPLVTLAKRLTNANATVDTNTNQGVNLQRQVTRFW